MRNVKLGEILPAKLLATFAVLCFIAVNTTAPAWAQRAGNKEIAAHAGDRQYMPVGYPENEWENSVTAVNMAFLKKPRWVEIDVQLNRHPISLDVNPNGLLFVHHEPKCSRINLLGQTSGPEINVQYDDPRQVVKCAERLDSFLAKYPVASHRGTRFILEMKASLFPGIGNDIKQHLPIALYELLKRRGQRTTEIVSSLNEDMLTALRDLGRADRQAPCSSTTGCKLPLMLVYGRFDNPNNAEMDRIKAKGFRYVNLNLAALTQEKVNYIKSIGMYVSGWHYADQDPIWSNTQAASLDLDIFMTDAIDDFRERFPSWR
jgi:glycerophosphoryl diester phosphodiesterase